MQWLKQNSFWLSFAWAFFIAVLSLTPGNYIPPIKWQLISPDTLAHFVFYGGLSFLLILYFQKNAPTIYKPIFYAFFICFNYGFLIELIQGNFIPGRFYDNYDLISNVMGTVFGVVLPFAKR